MNPDQNPDPTKASGPERERSSKRRKMSHPQPPLSSRQTRQARAKPRKVKNGRRARPQPPRQIRSQNIQGSKGRPRDFATNLQRTNASSTIISPSLATTPHTEPISKLSAPKSLLDQIFTRNKNQHRNQHWWKPLSMLRKGITRIVTMEEQEHALRGRIAQGMTSTSTGTGGMSAKDVRIVFEREGQVRGEREAWSEWVREVVVPKAYVGFGGLVREKQFAGLGVALMGLLAEVVGVLGGPRAEDGGQGVDEEEVVSVDGGKSKSLTARSLTVTGVASGEVVERTYDTDDVGEVVERRRGQESKSHAGMDEGRETRTTPRGSARKPSPPPQDAHPRHASTAPTQGKGTGKNKSKGQTAAAAASTSSTTGQKHQPPPVPLPRSVRSASPSPSTRGPTPGPSFPGPSRGGSAAVDITADITRAIEKQREGEGGRGAIGPLHLRESESASESASQPPPAHHDHHRPDGRAPPPTGLQGRERERNEGKGRKPTKAEPKDQRKPKPKSKSKSKSKPKSIKNAIDDLFAGFG